jgi:hypothetical protein
VGTRIQFLIQTVGTNTNHAREELKCVPTRGRIIKEKNLKEVNKSRYRMISIEY